MPRPWPLRLEVLVFPLSLSYFPSPTHVCLVLVLVATSCQVLLVVLKGELRFPPFTKVLIPLVPSLCSASPSIDFLIVLHPLSFSWLSSCWSSMWLLFSFCEHALGVSTNFDYLGDCNIKGSPDICLWTPPWSSWLVLPWKEKEKRKNPITNLWVWWQRPQGVL